MKERNTNTLTIISLGLLGFSLVSLAFWGVLKFSHNEPAGGKDQTLMAGKKSEEFPARTSASTNDRQRFDNSRLTAAISKADSLSRLLSFKTAECDSLKQAAANPPKPAATNEGTDEANRILSRKVTELAGRIQQLERENNQLTISLNRLESLRKKRVSVPLSEGEDSPPRTAANSSPHRNPLKLMIPSLKALYTAGIYEKETEEADQTELLKGSFTCENRTDESLSGEINMVLTDPAGHVVNISRESGVFDTEKGRIAYTCKFIVTLAGMESKNLPFRIKRDTFLKGNYHMELFFQGKSLAVAEILLK